MIIEGSDKDNNVSHVAINKGQMAVTTASAINKAVLKGDAFMWNAVSYDITAADTILTVRNLSPNRLLVINRLYAYTDVPGNYDVHIQTVATTFTTTQGAVVVGVNLNTGSNKVADADAISDEEAIAAQGSIIITLATAELTTAQAAIDFPTNDAIVLGTNGRIAIDASSEAALCEASIVGYFIDA